jgi:hypothetical protein
MSYARAKPQCRHTEYTKTCAFNTAVHRYTFAKQNFR